MEIDSATLREINKKYSRNRVETDSAALREIDKDLFKGLFHRAGLRQVGLLGLFLLFFHCIFLYSPLRLSDFARQNEQVGLLGIFSNLACPPRRVFP